MQHVGVLVAALAREHKHHGRHEALLVQEVDEVRVDVLVRGGAAVEARGLTPGLLNLLLQLVVVELLLFVLKSVDGSKSSALACAFR